MRVTQVFFKFPGFSGRPASALEFYCSVNAFWAIGGFKPYGFLSSGVGW